MFIYIEACWAKTYEKLNWQNKKNGNNLLKFLILGIITKLGAMRPRIGASGNAFLFYGVSF